MKITKLKIVKNMNFNSDLKQNNKLNISMHHVIDTLNAVRKELNRIATAIEDQNKLEKDKLNNNTLINVEPQTILLENK